MFINMKKVLMAPSRPELLNLREFWVIVRKSNNRFEDNFPDEYL